jgi:hypothetical protein
MDVALRHADGQTDGLDQIYNHVSHSTVSEKEEIGHILVISLGHSSVNARVPKCERCQKDV